MSPVAERFRTVAAAFSGRAAAVPPDGWDVPVPSCPGWVARDIVRHLVAWMPGYVTDHGGGILPTGPPTDDDPAGAWEALRAGMEAALDEERGGADLQDAVERFCIGDVLVHTWDLARAAGLDERLDPGEVHRQWLALDSVDLQSIRDEGQMGPAVDVPDDADEQTRLLAVTGRQP